MFYTYFEEFEAILVADFLLTEGAFWVAASHHNIGTFSAAEHMVARGVDNCGRLGVADSTSRPTFLKS